MTSVLISLVPLLLQVFRCVIRGDAYRKVLRGSNLITHPSLEAGGLRPRTGGGLSRQELN